jgi:FkbH-like protein
LIIASRNNEDAARKKLEEFGLWDYFLAPQISWGPKSEAVKRIIQDLNIGADSVAFIDDSPFERAEVKGALPEVREYDAMRLLDLPTYDEFSVPVTDESQRRRLLYRAEYHRKAVLVASPVDHDTFLENCGIVLTLNALTSRNQERVHELVQRTNQLNFSGNRYTREDVARLLTNPSIIPLVMDCEDTFGSYGIVGFSILRMEPDRVIVADMMFSCRIQGKKVEHSFLAHVIRSAAASGLSSCVCLYNKTQRNTPAGAVFNALGFAPVVEGGQVSNERYVIATQAPLRERLPVKVQDNVSLSVKLNLRNHDSAQ